MSNSRRARRQMAHHRHRLEQTIAAAAAHYPRMVSETVAELATPQQATTSRQAVREVGAVEARQNRPGRMLIQLIKAGWSLNGRYYPAEVLRRDGPSAFPAGTQAFIDHATDDEDMERPAGSVRNLAAVMTGPARWDDDRQALMGEVRLFQPWREALTDMAEHIGMSIRAWVTGEHGEADGRQGFVVASMPEGRSVDFVTVPAAGGQIVSVLESAQPQPADEARNVGAWLESRLHLALTQLGDEMYGDGRLTRPERITLSSAIGDALRAWTARVEQDAPQLFQRDLSDEPPAAVQQPADEHPDRAATGPPLMPSSETTADLQRIDRLLGHPPTDPPAEAGSGQSAEGAPPTAHRSVTEGASMSGDSGARAPDQAGTATEASPATTQPVEASEAQIAVVAQERDQYRARAHSLAEALTEAQNAQRAAEAQRDQAVTEMRRYRANEAGRQAVDRLLIAPESGVPETLQPLIGPRVHDRIVDNVPLTSDGEVDQQALESLVNSAIRSERVYAAQTLEAQGVGRVEWLGVDGDPTTQITQEQWDQSISGLWSQIGLDETTVKLATKGRI